MLQEFDRVIVVDWSCPENSGEFASDLGASVVYKYGQKCFERSAARNYGGKLVCTEYVAFIDADTLCMPGLGQEIKEKLSTKTMLLSSRTAGGYDIPNLFGFVACSLEAFRRVGGYDESYQGWGHEDSQLRGSLYLSAGLKVARLSPMALGAIAHGNELRDMNHAEPTEVSSRRNFEKLNEYFWRMHGVRDWMKSPITSAITFRPDPSSAL
jgi:N-terminal domain of galactosyltransferase